MIQELLGGSGLLTGGGQTQFSFNGTGTILEGSHSSSSSLSPPSPSITPTKGSTTNSSDPQQNLRCPRCNSLNTKFCYYNNYNLTQPRHFCKTCRRYWTKGGALRNIPIGGGCRKNKSNTIFSTTTTIGGCAKSSTSVERVLRGCLSSHDSGKSNMRNGFDHQSYNNPIVWPSSASSHNSQLLSLLGASPRNANPNSCLDMKTEESCMINGSSEVDMNSRVVSDILDHVVSSSQQVPFGLCSNSTTSSFLKNNNQEHSGLLFYGDHQVTNTGIQELYQRIRSSSANYYSTSHDHTVQPSTDGLNDVTNSTSTMSILESAPVTNGEGNMGFFNIPQFSWSDQLTTTTTGAFP